MAKELEEFPPDQRGRRPGGRYDWDTFLNGKVWQLEAGADFTAKPDTVRIAAYDEAKRRGGKARVSIREKGKIVVVQYLPKKSE